MDAEGGAIDCREGRRRERGREREREGGKERAEEEEMMMMMMTMAAAAMPPGPGPGQRATRRWMAAGAVAVGDWMPGWARKRPDCREKLWRKRRHEE